MAVSDYDSIIDEAAREWDVDPHWARSVMQQESMGNAVGANGRPITSKAGAVGLMQLMPKTWGDLGVADPTDPVQNIWGGVKYLAQMRDQFHGNIPLATAAYNAGPERVNGYIAGKQPLPNETMAYVSKVAGYYQRFAGSPAAAPAPAPAATPSDEDFLKSVTAPSGPPAQSAPAVTGLPSDDDFLKQTGAKPAAPPTPTAPSYDPGSDPAIRAQVGTGEVADNAATRIGNAAVEGAAQGYNASPSILTPAAQAAVDQGGPVGRWLVNPALKVAGGVLGAGNALMGAGSGIIAQGATELGVPALGRDINMAAQVAPAASMGFMHPSLPGVPSAVPTPRFVQEYYGEGLPGNPLASAGETASAGVRPNPLAAGVQSPAFVPPGAVIPPEMAASRPAFVPPNSLTTPEGQVVPVNAPPLQTRVPPGALPPPDAPSAPVPASVGAAASREQTPSHIVDMTPQEVQAYRSTAEGQKLLEPQQPGIRDANIYVDGVTPNSAEIEQNVNTARELKSLNITAPGVSQEAKEIAAANNEARQNYFAKIAGSDVDVMNAKAARAAQAESDLAATWANKTPADAKPVLDVAAEIKQSPDGRRPIVRDAVDAVTKELFDANGNLLTDPEMLYGVRKHIDDLMSKEARVDDPKAVRAFSNLGTLKTALDEVINKSAPNFADYLSNFADASKRIDEMEVLQKHEPKLFTGPQNTMTYNNVQRMMRNIVDSRQSAGINPYKSITDDTMQRLWALRDDLRRSAGAQELAKAPGSDSVQNAFDAVKNALVAHGAESAVHMAAHAMLPPIVSDLAATGINRALGSVFSGRTARRQTQRGMEMLYPQGRNPLSGGP